MEGKAKVYLFSILLIAALTVIGWAEVQNDESAEFGKFMTYYYLNPDPNKLPSMLKSFLKSPIWSQAGKFDEHAENPVAYFFAKAGESNPGIVKSYIDLFDYGTHRQRLFVLKILQLCGDESVINFFTSKLDAGRFINETKQIKQALVYGIPLDFDPLTKPIKQAGDLAFLWVEFIVTGSEKPVLKIIDSLAGPNDIADSNVIDNVIEAAKRTLAENCRRHDKVLQICKDELSAHDGSIKKILEEIVDSADGSISLQKRLEQSHEEKPVTGVKTWALGCSAVLIERNHGRHDFLSPDKINEKNIKKNRELLEKWWGIKNKGDLLSVLKRLKLEGHRSKFAGWGLLIQTLNEQEYKELLQKYQNDQKTLQRIRIVKEYYEKLGPKSLLGWDYTRYICLCRWGYLSAYIEEEEAWEKIMPVAREIPKTFDSWEDLGRNYIISRQFWSYEQTQEDGYLYEDAYQRLIDMPSSPWNKYPWDMDLTETESISEPNEVYSRRY